MVIHLDIQAIKLQKYFDAVPLEIRKSSVWVGIKKPHLTGWQIIDNIHLSMIIIITWQAKGRRGIVYYE